MSGSVGPLKNSTLFSMEASEFHRIAQLIIARIDLWQMIWFMFLVGAIGFAWWCVSSRPNTPKRIALTITFLLLSGVVGAWLAAIYSQLVALQAYAESIADTIDAAISLKAVDALIESSGRFALLDAIAPPKKALWLGSYFATISAVVSLTWYFGKDRSASCDNNEPNQPLQPIAPKDGAPVER